MLVALSPLFALLLAGTVLWALGKRCFAERIRQVAACETREQCDRLFGEPVYDLPLDDEDGIRKISWLCRGQKISPPQTVFAVQTGSSVAFYDSGCRLAFTKRFFFFQYDRKSGRVVRGGWMGV